MRFGIRDVGAVSAGCGTSAAVDAEALEDLLEVGLHGEEAAIQDDADLAIGLTFSHPVQHLRLAWREAEKTGKHTDGLEGRNR